MRTLFSPKILLTAAAALAIGFGGFTLYSADSVAQDSSSTEAAEAPAPSAAPADPYGGVDITQTSDGGTGTGVFPDDRIIGDVNAPVTMVEYSSMTCPHCRRFHEGAYKQIKSEYIDTGKVRLIYRDLPWDGMAFRAALIARCVPVEQFEPTVALIFKTQSSWRSSAEALNQVLGITGMTPARAEECVNNKAEQTRVLERREQALEELGVTGTPYIFIEGERLNAARPFADYQEVIEAKLGN